MVYRFVLSKNLKSLLLPLLAIALVAAAIALAIFVNVLLGILGLAVAGYMGYHFFMFFLRTLRSQVLTSDDGIVCTTSLGTESTVTWDELTHAGWYTSDSGYRELFVYAEKDDRLLTIPSQYESMDDLAREVFERTTLDPMSLSGEDADGVAEALRRHVAPEEEISDEEE